MLLVWCNLTSPRRVTTPYTETGQAGHAGEEFCIWAGRAGHITELGHMDGMVT